MSKHICVDKNGKKIAPRTEGQFETVRIIDEHDVSFIDGPAGTGKTFLATCIAFDGFTQGKFDRIILVRPAIEAGENLGFLPGDLDEKISPYMRPLYDNLEMLFNAKELAGLMANKTIEVVPFAYMRGRTLDKSFIILDEAQNTTVTQMKMFLTRIGRNSKMVIVGDRSQNDLPRNQRSGFEHAQHILQDVKGIGMGAMTEKDIIRHKIIGEIIKAYDRDYNQDKSKPL